MKLFFSLDGKTGQENSKTALTKAKCSMLITVRWTVYVILTAEHSYINSTGKVICTAITFFYRSTSLWLLEPTLSRWQDAISHHLDTRIWTQGIAKGGRVRSKGGGPWINYLRFTYFLYIHYCLLIVIISSPKCCGYIFGFILSSCV